MLIVIKFLYVEKKRMLKGKYIWKVKLFVCFVNDFFFELNIKVSDKLILFLLNMYI